MRKGQPIARYTKKVGEQAPTREYVTAPLARMDGSGNSPETQSHDFFLYDTLTKTNHTQQYSASKISTLRTHNNIERQPHTQAKPRLSQHKLKTRLVWPRLAQTQTRIDPGPYYRSMPRTYESCRIPENAIRSNKFQKEMADGHKKCSILLFSCVFWVALPLKHIS